MARLETLKVMVVAGDEDATRETEALLADGTAAKVIIDEALLPGMDVVGDRMRNGDCFIPEVLLSARTMQACLDIVRPRLEVGESSSVAKIVMGTVEGDVHDIGKNLVAMLLEGAGFEVVNLGRSVSTADFVSAVRDHKPDILGMSALLTTTIPRMSDTLVALEAEGLRDAVKVIVGGAPVSQSYSDEIGADAYGANAAVAVDKCRALAEELART